MKIKNKSLFVTVLLGVFFTVTISFLPVISVNVIFNRCLNENEIATVFRDTSFNSYQYYSVYDDAAGLSVTDNSRLFGTPLEGAELEAAISAHPRSTGIIVIDGNISLSDMAEIKKSPFVDKVTVYFPILDMGDRDILPGSSSYFFEKHPETRYWE